MSAIHWYLFDTFILHLVSKIHTHIHTNKQTHTHTSTDHIYTKKNRNLTIDFWPRFKALLNRRLRKQNYNFDSLKSSNINISMQIRMSAALTHHFFTERQKNLSRKIVFIWEQICHELRFLWIIVVFAQSSYLRSK